MPNRVHFIDVPPPDVVWMLGSMVDSEDADSSESPVGEVRPGAIVGGVAETSSAAVASLPGEAGQPTIRFDTAGCRRRAYPVLVSDDEGNGKAADPQFAAEASRATRNDLSTWLGRFESAGIRASRHNSPDLSRQLVAAGRRPIDVILCHTLDTDTTVPLQGQWALRHPAELREGLDLLARLTGARRSMLAAAEPNAKRLQRRLRRLAEQDRQPRSNKMPDRAGLRVVTVANAYPQADPALLARELVRRTLSPGCLPPEVGLLIIDAVTAIAVGEVARGATTVRKQPVAVRDHSTDVAVLAEVYRGTRVVDLLMFLGMLHSDVNPNTPPIHAGDYLRGSAIPPDAIIDGGELVIHLDTPAAITAMLTPPTPCIRCGWCIEICPTGVHPAGLLDAMATQGQQRAKLADRFGAAACIGCGLCSFVCPSRLPLLPVAVAARDSLKK